MEKLGDLAKQKSEDLKKREETIRLVGFDPMVEEGFSQIPNVVLTDKNLSVGAKLTYSMLLKYCWYDNRCFPGQGTLADNIGSSERSVRTWLKELDTYGIIKITRRGLGRPNVYEVYKMVKKRKMIKKQL